MNETHIIIRKVPHDDLGLILRGRENEHKEITKKNIS